MKMGSHSESKVIMTNKGLPQKICKDIAKAT